MKTRGVSAGLLAVAVLAAACGGGSSSGSGSSGSGGGGKSFALKIGDLVPLTGDLSVFAPAGVKAAKMAVDDLNKALQDNNSGIKVSIEEGDTQTDPTASVSAARKLVSDGATCLAGAWASADTIPIGQSVSSREKVPQISPASTSAAITNLNDNGYVFRTAPSDILQGKALMDVVKEDLGGASGKTVSFAARNDAYGSGFINVAVDAWKQMGGKANGPVLYDPQAASFDSEAGKIVQGNPDAYVIIDFPDTFAKMGAALLRTGNYDPKKLYTADGLANDTVPKGVPAGALEGAKGTRPGTPENTDVVKAFNDAFTAAGGAARGTFDAQNFDAVMLCGLAAIAADSNKGSDIQAKLTPVSGAPGTKYTFQNLDQAVKDLLAGKDIDYEGVTGPIDFDSHGDPSAATYEVWQYQNDGKLKVIKQFQASES